LFISKFALKFELMYYKDTKPYISVQLNGMETLNFMILSVLIFIG